MYKEIVPSYSVSVFFHVRVQQHMSSYSGKRFSTTVIIAISTVIGSQNMQHCRINTIMSELRICFIFMIFLFPPFPKPPLVGRFECENIWKQKYFKTIQKCLKAFRNYHCTLGEQVFHTKVKSLMYCKVNSIVDTCLILKSLKTGPVSTMELTLQYVCM